MVLHAFQSSNPVVVVATDAGILLLLIYAYFEVQFKTGGIYSAKWFMKIDNERYVNIKLICGFYGPDVFTMLPAFHSLTGCDTNPFPFGCGKVKPYKKMLQQKKQDLLNDFRSTLTRSDMFLLMLLSFLKPSYTMEGNLKVCCKLV